MTSGLANLSWPAQELVAFQGGSESRWVFLAEYFTYTAQANLFSHAWSAGQGYQVLDRFSQWKPALRREEHTGGTHVLGLSTDGQVGTVGDYFERKTQFEALVFSMFGGHSFNRLYA